MCFKRIKKAGSLMSELKDESSADEVCVVTEAEESTDVKFANRPCKQVYDPLMMISSIKLGFKRMECSVYSIPVIPDLRRAELTVNGGLKIRLLYKPDCDIQNADGSVPYLSCQEQKAWRVIVGSKARIFVKGGTIIPKGEVELTGHAPYYFLQAKGELPKKVGLTILPFLDAKNGKTQTILFLPDDWERKSQGVDIKTEVDNAEKGKKAYQYFVPSLQKSFRIEKSLSEPFWVWSKGFGDYFKDPLKDFDQLSDVRLLVFGLENESGLVSVSIGGKPRQPLEVGDIKFVDFSRYSGQIAARYDDDVTIYVRKTVVASGKWRPFGCEELLAEPNEPWRKRIFVPRTKRHDLALFFLPETRIGMYLRGEAGQLDWEECACEADADGFVCIDVPEKHREEGGSLILLKCGGVVIWHGMAVDNGLDGLLARLDLDGVAPEILAGMRMRFYFMTNALNNAFQKLQFRLDIRLGGANPGHDLSLEELMLKRDPEPQAFGKLKELFYRNEPSKGLWGVGSMPPLKGLFMIIKDGKRPVLGICASTDARGNTTVYYGERPSKDAPYASLINKKTGELETPVYLSKKFNEEKAGRLAEWLLSLCPRANRN